MSYPRAFAAIRGSGPVVPPLGRLRDDARRSPRSRQVKTMSPPGRQARQKKRTESPFVPIRIPAAVLLLGCASSTRDPIDTGDVPAQDRQSNERISVSTCRSSSERLPVGFSWRLTVAPSRPQRDDTVHLRLVIYNDSSPDPLIREMIRNPRSAAAFGIRRHPHLQEVWSNAIGLELDLARSYSITLGDSLVLTGEWTQTDNDGVPVPAGLYWIRSWLAGSRRDLATPPVAVMVRPG